MSTTRYNLEPLEDPEESQKLEKAEGLLEDTPYELDETNQGYRLIEEDTEEFLAAYRDVEELLWDLEKRDIGAEGPYGFFQNDDIAVLYARWAGDNLVESTEAVDLEDMR